MIENFDPAVRKIARRLADHRRRLIIGGGIECNAHLVEQAGNRAHFGGRTIADVSNGLRLQNNRLRQSAGLVVDRDHYGNQHVTHSGVTGLQFSNSDFNRLRHGGVLSLPVTDPIRARFGAHRLSETSK